MKLDLAQLRQQAQDRWPDILNGLGIPAEVLATRRNQPCPACGGNDRFQWIDKGRGRFVCRALETAGGDGFVLVQHWLGCDFLTAAQAVARVLGGEGGGTPRPIAPPRPVASPADQRTQVLRLWESSHPVTANDPVGRYLANRGLTLTRYPASLRLHRSLPYWLTVKGKPVKLGRFPAMLAAIKAPDGYLVGLHRTWLTAAGEKARLVHPVTGEALPVKKVVMGRAGDLEGAAIQLSAPRAGQLAIAEGIETALAVRQGSGLPCWAALSAWGLSHVRLPDSIRDVFVMADNDANQAGQNAARRLVKRLQDDARQVHLLIPESRDSDWLDVLNQQQGEPHGQP
jgi:putative DNA primase/helicase